MKKVKFDAAFDKSHWDWLAVDIFFKLINNQNLISANDFRRECRKVEMPPFHISRTAALFKSMKVNGYIKPTDKWVNSENGGKPLIVYQVCHKKGQK
jgi:hypothetical protein